MDPALWGLERRDGQLVLDGQPLPALAAAHGSPLHVVSAGRLRARCRELRAAFSGYPARVGLHFSYKTNLVAGVLQVLHAEGLGAEVVDGYELWLARRLGLAGADVVFNGPNKTDAELTAAVSGGVGLIVVDGTAELERLEASAARLGQRASVALRICPDVVPRGLNASSVAGSRRNQFGFDPGSDALEAALGRAVRSPHLRLRGIHCHIGSGIHDLDSFRLAARRVLAVQARAFQLGGEPDLIDLGGGLGTGLSRELTSLELLLYLGVGLLPRPPAKPEPQLLGRYGAALAETIAGGARDLGIPVPALLLEPGRVLVSDAGVLLLTVGAVRQRARGARFAIADGGALTVSMMFLSELHAVLLANRDAPDDGRTNIFGRLPSPLDVVYRGLRTPRLKPGDLLAVMDAGAYFTSTSTNFGGPRPPVLLLDGGAARLVRRRETYEDLACVELELGGAP